MHPSLTLRVHCADRVWLQVGASAAQRRKCGGSPLAARRQNVTTSGNTDVHVSTSNDGGDDASCGANTRFESMMPAWISDSGCERFR